MNRIVRRGLLAGAAAATGTAALPPLFAIAAPSHPVAAAFRPGLFRSFFLGGFECSTHRRADGRRLDLIAATRHDLLAEQDYRQLAGHGIRAARDGVRWHLVEGGASAPTYGQRRPNEPAECFRSRAGAERALLRQAVVRAATGACRAERFAERPSDARVRGLVFDVAHQVVASAGRANNA